MKQNEAKKVFVGISGGVDSSVSAALLKEQGYDVTGVFIRVWQPPFLECSIKDDRRDAMRVCAQLGIPFLECDAEEAYKTKVIDYMMDEYKVGRTPNPDVMCNKHVKFGIFFDWAMDKGADCVATGHYAQTKDGKLMKGVSAAKDQSYFLWAIGPEKLARTLFPIGGYEKDSVRALAKKFGLFTADKKDSQGLCFLGKLDVKDFLKKFIEPKKGKVFDQHGEAIGEHDGAFFFTIGERHGFTVDRKTPEDEALYVIAKNIEHNTITVAPKSHKNNGLVTECLLENLVMYHPELLKIESIAKKAAYRYHGEEVEVRQVEQVGERLKVTLACGKPDIASGQSMILYSDNMLIAGGIIAL
jgi:tRNA-uridine 2-sulfurtransferase